MFKNVCVYQFQNVFLRCPTPRLHCFLFSHWPSFRFLSFITFFIPSIQFFFSFPHALFCFVCSKIPPSISMHYATQEKIASSSSEAITVVPRGQRDPKRKQLVSCTYPSFVNFAFYSIPQIEI
jgi:hypothetical protein